jgi:hypothetical protein
LFFSKELIDTIVTETNRYAEQFLRGSEMSVRSPARAWKETCDRRRNVYCTRTIYAYGHRPETNTEVLFYHQKVDFHTGI